MKSLNIISTAFVGIALGGCAHASTDTNSQVNRFARSFIETLSPTDIATFQKADKGDLPMFHFGAGSRVRQLYFRVDGEGRKALCVRYTYCDIDHQSARIVERTWEIIHGAG